MKLHRSHRYNVVTFINLNEWKIIQGNVGRTQSFYVNKLMYHGLT